MIESSNVLHGGFEDTLLLGRYPVTLVFYDVYSYKLLLHMIQEFFFLHEEICKAIPKTEVDVLLCSYN